MVQPPVTVAFDDDRIIARSHPEVELVDDAIFRGLWQMSLFKQVFEVDRTSGNPGVPSSRIGDRKFRAERLVVERFPIDWRQQAHRMDYELGAMGSVELVASKGDRFSDCLGLARSIADIALVWREALRT
jgi:hypothetical protein